MAAILKIRVQYCLRRIIFGGRRFI